METSSDHSRSAQQAASDMDRRDFVKAAAAAGAGLVLLSSRPWFASDVLSRAAADTCRWAWARGGACTRTRSRKPTATRRRWSASATSIRAGWSFAEALPRRAARGARLRGRRLRAMVRETKPDSSSSPPRTPRTTTTSSAPWKLGCDVITEKPMTTDADEVPAHPRHAEATGRRCRVTFNYRYSPPRTQVKDLLMSGVIGDVLSVDFHWLLEHRCTAPTTSAAGTATRRTPAA